MDKNKNPKTLASAFKKNALIAIISTAVLIGLMVIYLEFNDFSKRADKIEEKYTESQKVLIKQEVTRVTDYIARQRALTQEKIRARIKQRVYEAHAIATNIFNQFNGTLPEKKIKKLIMEALRPLRFFNSNGYYFIHSLDGVLQLHSMRKNTEGLNRLNFKSSTGQYIVRDLLSIIKKDKEGFLSYKYPSPENSHIEKHKFTFVKLFKPYNWSIGTGDYIDNIEQDTKKNLLKHIENISFGENSYIFVVNYDGDILMNSSQKRLVGKNMSKLTDPNGVNVFLEERKAVENPNGDFIYYAWNKPSSSSPSPKVAFIKGIPDWKWMIGTGVYLDDVQFSIEKQRGELKNKLVERTFYMLAFIIIGILIATVYSYRFTKRFTNELNQFSLFFSNVSKKSEKINIPSIYYLEFKQLAESANQMLEEKIFSENLLVTSKNKLKEAQRITHFGNWERDIEKNELFWSEEVYRIFECDPEEFSPTYTSFAAYIHPDDKLRVDEAYNLSIKNHEVYNAEHRICLSDGKIKYVREHAETQYDDENIAIRTSGTIQDITELKEKEEQLRRTLKMDALGKLIGGIAHDYNNMIGIVLGYTELLEGEIKGKKTASEYVEKIQEAGVRAKELTQKLMTFSRNKISKKENVNINEQLEYQRQLLEKTLTARIKLSFELDDNIWLTQMDNGDLNDAIINIAINASHAIKANGTLKISTKNIQLNNVTEKSLGLPAGEYIALSLSDSGKGMDSQTTSKIFDPFFSTKGEQGTGLGLSQVYGFVTRSGGAIKVNSELNLGTELILYFPRYYDSNSEQEIIESTNKNTSLPSHETILVVDDEEALCNMAKEILANQGYHVLLAFNGAQALEILKTERVDIVFSDVIMPEMTGYELATKISDKYPNILIQLTSGYAGDEKLKSLDNSSTFDILNKPYASSELLNKIKNLLNK